jgi:Flp pilus assembly protein protease CpaA
MLKIILLALILIIALIISYQDLKERLISEWCIFAYAILCFALTWTDSGFTAIGSNLISIILLFIFSYGLTTLKYLIKHQVLPKITDEKMGLADVLLILCIGLTIDPVMQIFFFTASFIIAALVGLHLAKKQNTIPLGALMVIQHFLILSSINFCPEYITDFYLSMIY